MFKMSVAFCVFHLRKVVLVILIHFYQLYIFECKSTHFGFWKVCSDFLRSPSVL